MSDYQERTNRFAAVEGEYAGYTVRDRDGSKVGKVDDLFLDENDRPEYIGVKMGFFGTRSTLIPLDACTVDGGRGFVEVNKTKQEVKDAPNFDDGEITPDYERRVREYYGLGAGGGSDLEDEDELRVQRSEEETRVGIGEREAGKLNVRKHVKTERQRIAVPKRREEVSVERVSVNDASRGQIGENEVSVPVVEEEVAVDKRAVVKEEIRVRKDVVEDEEVVEEDVRKEEVDTDDTSAGRGNR